MACTKQMQTEMLHFTITARDVKCAVKSQAYSKTFIKLIIKASLINILYHRLEIDETQFQEKNFEGVPYMTYVRKATDPAVRQFHSWVIGFGDALAKGYIRYIHLFMIDHITKQPVESYKFALKYVDDNQHTPVAAEDLTQTSVNFLKTLRLLADHPKLTRDTILHVEFAYFDHTPEEYEPPGFEPSKELLSLNSDKENLGKSLSLGKISTGYHTVSCSARGQVFFMSRSTTPAPMNEEEQAQELNEEQAQELTEEQMDTCLDSEVFAITENFTNKAVVNSNITEDNNLTERDESQGFVNELSKSITSVVNVTLESDDSLIIDAPNNECICELQLFAINIDFIQCDRCNKKYHIPCCGFHDKNSAPAKFICILCDKIKSNDKIMCRMPSTEYQTLTRVRIFLFLINKYQEIPQQLVRQIPGDISAKILAKLHKLSVLKKTDDERISVDFEVLKVAVANFFNNSNDSQVLETQITEVEEVPKKKRHRKY